MSDRLAMRAASLSTAALLLAAAIVAALSMRFIIDPAADGQQPAPYVTIIEEPPKETPPVRPNDPPRAPEEATLPFTAPIPFDDAAPPEQTFVEVAKGTPEGPITITRPDWVRRPTNLARYYPQRAQAVGREGVVQLDCTVRVSGRLDCVVASETPPGWRFGEAAQRIAAEHQMVPATRNGVPVEARYRMRVPFNLNE